MLMLQYRCFCLQGQPTMSLCCLFTMLNIFKSILYNQLAYIEPKCLSNYEKQQNHPSNCKCFKSPTIEHWNKLESAGNVKKVILGMPFVSLIGTTVYLEIGLEQNTNMYQITVNMFLAYTCLRFVDMSISTIEDR